VTHDGPERELPHDPDLEVDEGAGGEALPVHLTPHLVFLVFLGGTIGVLLRAIISDHVAVDSVFPWATLGINIAGAFALSVLIEGLALRGSDLGHRRRFRLLLGTGLLGGFTTYSALAVQTDSLLRQGDVVLALLYSLGTVVVGFAASVAGIAITRRELDS
jgi:CrcB protein